MQFLSLSEQLNFAVLVGNFGQASWLTLRHVCGHVTRCQDRQVGVRRLTKNDALDPSNCWTPGLVLHLLTLGWEWHFDIQIFKSMSLPWLEPFEMFKSVMAMKSWRYRQYKNYLSQIYCLLVGRTLIKDSGHLSNTQRFLVLTVVAHVILVSAQVLLDLTLGLWTLGLRTWAWQ